LRADLRQVGTRATAFQGHDLVDAVRLLEDLLRVGQVHGDGDVLLAPLLGEDARNAELVIEDIAEAADVSEGTLYVYFSSRKEMLLAALESILDEMYRLIDGSTGTDALARLRKIEEAHSQEMSAGRGLLAYPWFEFIAAGPQVGIRDAVADTHRSAYQHLKKIIEDGKAKGAIRSDADPDRLAWGFYTVLWAENIACMMGLREYLDQGHSAHILNLILTDAIKRQFKRRTAIEPVIGHCKGDHRMGRNFLVHDTGNAANALLAAAGYNFIRILAWLAMLFFVLCLAALGTQRASQNQIVAA